jgi:hypothetical protein
MIRDTVVPLGAAVYTAGYIVWALFAWTRDLGPVAPLDAQYFVAGVPVLALLAVLAITATKALKALSRLSLTARLLISAAPGVVGGIWSLAASYTDVRWWRYSALAVLVIGGAIGVLAQPFAPAARARVAFAAIFVCVVATWFYSWSILEHIPTEFGGGEPRCAILTIDSRRIGRQTRGALQVLSSTRMNPADILSRAAADVATSRLDAQTTPPDEGILEVGEVYVWMMNSDWVLLGPRSTVMARMVQLPTPAVQAITWCAED